MNIAAHAIDRSSAQPFEERPSIADLKSRLAGISPQIFESLTYASLIFENATSPMRTSKRQKAQKATLRCFVN